MGVRPFLTTAVRLTDKRKKAFLDFRNAFGRVRFHDYTDPRILPFQSAKANGAPVLVDGVIFHEAWASMHPEMSWSDPAGAWQVVAQERGNPITFSDPHSVDLGMIFEEDAFASFRVSYGNKLDGKPITSAIKLWVRADDPAAVFTDLTKWLSDKAYWLNLLSA